jgi:hypothetical protein
MLLAPIWRTSSHQRARRDPSWCASKLHNRSRTILPCLFPTGHSPCKTLPFYKELANQGLKATDVPVVAFSVDEEELRGIDTKSLMGNLAAWNCFESVERRR